MVSDLTARQERQRLAARTREQADVLLHRLLQDRLRSEERFAEAGRNDPLKDLTGASALDRAIDDTRRMIRHMDELLRSLEIEAAGVNGVSSNGTTNGAANGSTLAQPAPREPSAPS